MIKILKKNVNLILGVLVVAVLLLVLHNYMQKQPEEFKSRNCKKTEFIVFSKNGCPYCEEMKEDWLKLQEYVNQNFSDRLKVSIYKLDTHPKEFKHHDRYIDGYPTILLKKCDLINKNFTIIPYQEERKLSNFKIFLRKHKLID